MKKIISIKSVSLLLLSVLLLGLLSACGGGGASTGVEGTYNGLYTKFVGDGDDARDTESPFTLVLEKGGKGKHMRDDLELDVTWQLDGENFTMTETFMGLTIDYTGTLSGTSLHLFNNDPQDPFTCEYVYEKAN